LRPEDGAGGIVIVVGLVERTPEADAERGIRSSLHRRPSEAGVGWVGWVLETALIIVTEPLALGGAVGPLREPRGGASGSRLSCSLSPSEISGYTKRNARRNTYASAKLIWFLLLGLADSLRLGLPASKLASRSFLLAADTSISDSVPALLGILADGNASKSVSPFESSRSSPSSSTSDAIAPSSPTYTQKDQLYNPILGV